MKRFLTFLFLTLPFFTKAQSNFHKGYVVTNSNDTLSGYINYKERALNPSSVQFKKTPEDKVQVFDLSNCSAYTVDGLDVLQRFVVDISGNKVNVGDLTIGRDSSFRRDTVFLRVLREGKHVTLYAYKDYIKERFYLKEKERKEPYELNHQIFLDPEATTQIIETKEFSRQLFSVADKYSPGSMSFNKLNALKYRETDLISAISMINGQEKLTKSKYQKTRLFAGAGLNFSTAAYSGENRLANSAAKSKASYLPYLTAGIDGFANPAIGKLIYRLELSFLMSKQDISTTTQDQGSAALNHVFDQYSAVLTPQLIYNVYNSDPLKIFIGAGLGLNFSAYGNNKSTTYNSFRDETTIEKNKVVFQKFTVSTPFRTGVVLHKKLELSAAYFPSSGLTAYSFFNINMQRFTVGLNYLFNK